MFAKSTLLVRVAHLSKVYSLIAINAVGVRR